ncbi:MAG: Rossmann-like domain-containing protein [Conexivisphaera sp.]
MILDAVAKALRSIETRSRIVDVFVGYSYAAASASDGFGRCVGLAAVPRSDISCRDERWSVPRVGGSPRTVAAAIRSTNVLERTVAFAAANAISQCLMRAEKPRGMEYVEDVNGWLVERLRTAGASRIALIGNMPPVASKLREEFDLMIFERDPGLRSGDVMPDFLELRLLPRADAVVASGTSLLNESLDLVLRSARRSRLNAVVGPTAQLHPRFLRGTYVDFLGSTEVVDSRDFLRMLRHGVVRGALYDARYARQYYVEVPRE